MTGWWPIRPQRNRLWVAKTGAGPWPWETRCPACIGGEIKHFTDAGVVVVNTRGIGNRTQDLAMLAANTHVAWHREQDDQ